MSHLKAVPRSSDLEPSQRAVTFVSRDSRNVVYLDQPASLEIITEALKAWGLRVRAERADSRAPAPATLPVVTEAPAAAPAEATWQTTRPDAKAPTRLDNVLSPLWLPLRDTGSGGDASSTWGWFTRAA